MKHRRLAAALAGGATLAAVLGGTATAATAAPAAPQKPAATCQPYPANQQCTVTVSVTVVTPGGTFTITIKFAFYPGETVEIRLFSTPVVLGQLKADANGSVSGTFQVPANITPGTHTIEAVGLTSGRTASTTITVEPASSTATGSGSLPFTGADVAAMSAVGGALVLGGAAAVAMGSRRKRQGSAA